MSKQTTTASVPQKPEGAGEAPGTPPDAPAPSSPDSDDLTTVKGIGPVVARKLAAAGVTSYAALAALGTAERGKLDGALDVPGGADWPAWQEQAAELAGATAENPGGLPVQEAAGTDEGKGGGKPVSSSNPSDPAATGDGGTDFAPSGKAGGGGEADTHTKPATSAKPSAAVAREEQTGKALKALGEQLGGKAGEEASKAAQGRREKDAGGASGLASAPPADPDAVYGAAGYVLVVKTKRGRDRRRRAGYTFGPAETLIPCNTITLREARAIMEDPALEAETAEAGEAPAAAGAGPAVRPSIGRIVLYTLAEDEDPVNGARTFPAVVVSFHGGPDELVNLRVLYDQDPAGARARGEWETSIRYSPRQGEPFSWTWPPREGGEA